MPEEDFLNLEYQRDQLLEIFEGLKDAKSDQCFRAFELAKEEHRGQKRGGGRPYVIHPIRASLIVPRELNLYDADLLASLLLHDVAEDGTVSLGELEDEFAPEIARLVRGVHRPRPENESEEEKRRSKLEKIRKVSKKDKKVRIVALCDVLDNMRSATYLPENHPLRDKFPRWRKELKHWLPIADSTHSVLAEELTLVFGKLS